MRSINGKVTLVKAALLTLLLRVKGESMLKFINGFIYAQ